MNLVSENDKLYFQKTVDNVNNLVDKTSMPKKTTISLQKNGPAGRFEVSTILHNGDKVVNKLNEKK